MKVVFSATHSLEAHMVKNLLEIERINAFILGEHLQGGAGDLQTIDLVKISVHDEDFAKARQIIEIWEAEQPVTITEAAGSRKANPGSYLLVLLAGILLGASINWDLRSLAPYQPLQVTSVCP